MREINALVNSIITERLVSSGFTLHQITAIRLLAHRGEMTMSELGQEMNASPSTVAGIIDRLEASGTVTRRRDTEQTKSLGFLHRARFGTGNGREVSH